MIEWEINILYWVPLALKDKIIDVQDGFKECDGFCMEEVEAIIEDIYPVLFVLDMYMKYTVEVVLLRTYIACFFIMW